VAVLYRDSGNLDNAIRALHESKQLCEKHGLKFDGEDILQECLEENKDSQRIMFTKSYNKSVTGHPDSLIGRKMLVKARAFKDRRCLCLQSGSLRL